jgi:hypothetical protein
VWPGFGKLEGHITVGSRMSPLRLRFRAAGPSVSPRL